MAVVALVHKKTYVVCTKAQRSPQPAILFFYVSPWQSYITDFDTTISHSFLGQILVEDAEIHRKSQLWAPIEFVSH